MESAIRRAKRLENGRDEVNMFELWELIVAIIIAVSAGGLLGILLMACLVMAKESDRGSER